MLKNKLKFLIAFLATIVMFSSTFVFADETDSSTDATQTNPEEGTALISENPESETQNSTQPELKKSDVYLTDNNVTIDYIVDGNVFIIGNNVTINSQIGGDAFIIANHVTIGENAYIFSNLFVCADNIDMKGVVYDIYACGNSINISGYVYRDVKFTGNNFSLLGTVGKDAFLSGISKVSFTENVNQDENVATSQGSIVGNLNYETKNELSIDENAVNGNIVYTAPITKSNTIGNYLLKVGSFLGLLLIVWLLLLWLAPRFLNKTSILLKEKPAPVIGFGLLGLIAIPIIAFILLLIGITASASLLLLAFYFIFLMASTSISVIAINNIVCDKLKISKLPQRFGILVIAGIIVWAICLIPYVGTLVSFILAVLGLGIIFTHLFTRNKTPKTDDKKVKEVKAEKSDKKVIESKKDKEEKIENKNEDNNKDEK